MVVNFDPSVLHHNYSRFIRPRRIGGSETPEIVTAGEQFAGTADGIQIEVLLYPPDDTLVECGFSDGDAVDVLARDSIVARVEIAGSFLDIDDDDVGGQPVV
jgi:hypothetical protein